MAMREHYDAVLEDLKETRVTVASNLADLDSAIDCVERMLLWQPIRRVAPTADPTQAAPVAPAKSAEPEAKPPAPAVLLRDGTLLTSAQSQISTMLRESRLHKGEDLIIRNVKDGKVQGLPPMGTGYMPSRGISPYAQ